MLSMLSNKLGIPYPIFLVIAGLVIGFIPGIPVMVLEPDIIFLIFLPPLLFAGAWNTSWKDFWAARRPITLLSVGLVIFTATAIAFLSHAMIPGFTLALGFLLGSIISPPDAVAATSVLQSLKVPKSVVTILEGESMLNDASSLIVFRFSLAAIVTGQFSFWKAGTDFFIVAGIGIIIGIAIAAVVYLVHRFLPTSPSIDTALTLISPYVMYIAAEHFKCSGVMAVVSGGLFLSYRSDEMFSYNSRIQTYSFWATLTFLLTGLVFILLGLQLPQIVKGLGEYSLTTAILYGIIISVVTIIIRIAWVFPGAYLPHRLSKRVRINEKSPAWKSVFLVAWSGMRGVIALAAALAVPLTLGGDKPFPQRNLLLFIAFTVILITLVLQGLSLPWVIRKLNIKAEDEKDLDLELALKLQLAEAAVDHLKQNYPEEIKHNEAYTRVKERYERMINLTYQKLVDGEKSTDEDDFLPRYRNMLLELVTVRRESLKRLRHEKLYADELIRNKERELDLEEARLNE